MELILVMLMAMVAWGVSGYVLLGRAGFWEIKAKAGVDWREFLLGNPLFFVILWGKAVLWPVVFVTWLVQGQPDSPWTATTRLNGREVRAVLRAADGTSR